MYLLNQPKFIKGKQLSVISLFLALTSIPITSFANDIEEVIVTGDRLQRNLQETVVSARVFNELSIETLNAFSVVDLLNTTANVIAEDGSFTIRGIRNDGVTRNQGASDAASVFVDGVTVTSNNTSSATLGIWDVASVEVLRGAQSTNQGANTLAGAIIIRTQDPTFEFSSRMRLRAGQKGNQEAAIAFGGGLIEDVLAYRVSLQHIADDGYVKNITLNDDEWDREEQLNGRIKLLWQPAGFEDTNLLLTLSRQDVKSRGNSVRSLDPFDREAYSNTPDQLDKDLNEQASLELSHQINDRWALKSISAWSQYETEFRSDGDSTPILNTLSYFPASQDLWSQEFRLNYSSDKLRAVLGLYTANTLYDYSSDRIGQVTDIDGSGPFPPVVLNYETFYGQENTNAAIYFDSDYDLTDRLTLNFGFRVDKTTVDYNSSLEASRGSDLTLLGLDPVCAQLGLAQYGLPVSGCNQLTDILLNVANGTGSGDATDTAFLPKAGLTFAITDDINVGFSIQRAFRSAGAALNVATSQVISYDPEFSTNYEVSLRTQWLDQSLTINANAFYVDWEDQQVVVRNPFNTYDSFTTNAGKSVLKGMELELNWQASDTIDTYLSLGIVETAFKEFTSFNVDYSGNEFPFASDTTLSFGVNWYGNNGFFSSLNGRFASENFSNIDNSSGPKAYTVFDGHFGYATDNWKLTAYVKNLADRDYVTADYGLYTVGGYSLNTSNVTAPRRFGATLEYTL